MITTRSSIFSAVRFTDSVSDSLPSPAMNRWIGIGRSLAAPPSHTTLRTGPYRAVRLKGRVSQLAKGDRASRSRRWEGHERGPDCDSLAMAQSARRATLATQLRHADARYDSAVAVVAIVARCSVAIVVVSNHRVPAIDSSSRTSRSNRPTRASSASGQ